MVEPELFRRGRFYAGQTAREAAIFAAVAALFVDVVFYFSLADKELSAGSLTVWSGLKFLVIAGVVGWLAAETREWALGLVAVIFLLIGLEDSVGVTAPLGLWLLEESGLRRGPQGANSQVLRRVAVMVLLLGPTLYVAERAPQGLRRAVWALIGFLAAIFLAAVVGDLVADRTGTNLDELVEEPLLSLCMAFTVGLAVQWWPRRRFRIPTTRRPRRRSRRS